MYTLIVRENGTLDVVSNGTDGGKRAYRQPYANDHDYRLPNNIDAILADKRDTQAHRRARNHAEAWGH
jgi:hypothetical protein